MTIEESQWAVAVGGFAMAAFEGPMWALRRNLAIGAGAVLILSASCSPALAYLDPGTGSIILQSIIAGVIGSMALARMYWTRLKDVLRRIFSSDRRQDKHR
ncbi:MAG TPA: hypothetical protein VGF43_03905 [Dongiaceae bacterium]|jgi:hypothetical protein